MKISHKLCVRMKGTQFYDYDGLQPKFTSPKHLSRQYMYVCDFLIDLFIFLKVVFDNNKGNSFNMWQKLTIVWSS